MTSVITVQDPSASPPKVVEVAVRRPTALDTEAVLAMVGRCSRASLFHRFHGFTDGVAYFGALLRDRPDDHTLLAWSGPVCVGVATLGVGATGIVDLGALVEDGWQRRRIGIRLIASLLDEARARGLTTVHADVLVDDAFILRALRRIAPLSVSPDRGSYSIDINLSREVSNR